MKIIYLNDADYQQNLQALSRRPACPPHIEEAVTEIVRQVRERGDAAICEFVKRFDGVDMTPEQYRVTDEEIREARSLVSRDNRRAIDLALKHVQEFAKRTKPASWTYHPRRGVTLGEMYQPMRRVACYVPGGTAPLVSTSVHTVGIAKAAGVESIAAMTPPMKNGKINPHTLYALSQAGATEIYKLGGAYAVAALALGTETIEKAELVAGPGNAYVAAAKRLIYGQTAVDMVAGPSEIMILADGKGNPAFAAADVLSQAEHGSGLEHAVLVSPDADFLRKVEKEMYRQAESLTRQGPLQKVLENGVFFVEVADMDAAAAFAGDYAPEHLEIHCEKPEDVAKKVRAAGAIFLGEWTPEPAGDFTAGPSHVLPTGGTAKFFHGLTCSDFMRRSSILKYGKTALWKELYALEAIADMEGLDAHKRSASIRRTGGVKK